MKMIRKWMISGMLVASLLLVGIALAAPNAHSIDWWTISSGGGSDATGSTSLSSTTGQWVAGSDTNGSTQLGYGFWSGVGKESYEIYLPLVLKSF